jgi:hypothetical protein
MATPMIEMISSAGSRPSAGSDSDSPLPQIARMRGRCA